MINRDVLAVSRPELGTKRECQSCSAKFYDLNKDPIICPKCGTVYQVAVAQTRMRAATETARESVVADEDDVVLDDAAELISLEDVDEGDDETKGIPDADIDLEDDLEDDPFLPAQDEDDEDDVTSLIDGDLREDDEQ